MELIQARRFRRLVKLELCGDRRGERGGEGRLLGGLQRARLRRLRRLRRHGDRRGVGARAVVDAAVLVVEPTHRFLARGEASVASAPSAGRTDVTSGAARTLGRTGEGTGVWMAAKSIADVSERPRGVSSSSSTASEKSAASLSACAPRRSSGSVGLATIAQLPMRSSGEEASERGDSHFAGDQRRVEGLYRGRDHRELVGRAARREANASSGVEWRWQGVLLFLARFRAVSSSSTSRGITARHLRLTYACLMPVGWKGGRGEPRWRQGRKEREERWGSDEDDYGCICAAPAWPPRLPFAAAVCAAGDCKRGGVWTVAPWAAELCLVGAVEAVAAILLRGETRGMSGLQTRNGARATRPSARGGKGHGQAY